MDVKQLQSLLAIADHGTFSAAAKALDTVQSNVSAHIARLEKELGAVLVDRSRSSLTEEGEMVATRARRIVHEMEDIDADIHSLGDSAVGDSRVGTIGTTARWLMPRLLTTLSRQHPGVRMTITEGATTALIPLLNAGDIDAAIIHLPVGEGEYEVRELFAESLLLLCAGSHELAGRTEISITELAEHPILLAPRGTVQRRIIDRAAASSGVTLRSQAEIDGVRLMTSLAFEGFGAAIVPATAIPGWLQGDFVRITVPELPRRVVGWVQRARPRPNRATRAVRDVASQIVQTHGDRQPGVFVTKEPGGVRGQRGGRSA